MRMRGISDQHSDESPYLGPKIFSRRHAELLNLPVLNPSHGNPKIQGPNPKSPQDCMSPELLITETHQAAAAQPGHASAGVLRSCGLGVVFEMDCTLIARASLQIPVFIFLFKSHKVFLKGRARRSGERETTNLGCVPCVFALLAEHNLDIPVTSI